MGKGNKKYLNKKKNRVIKNMGKQEKMRGANVRALLIFRRIQNIKKQAMERVAADVNNFFKEAIGKNEIDFETAEVLKNVYFSKKGDATEDIIRQSIDSFRDELRASKQDGVDKIFLTLSSDGDLYKKPKEGNCYPMEKSGLRLKIIHFLRTQEDFISGNYIAIEMGTTYGSITSAIKEINERSRNLIHLPEGNKYNLIISRLPHGGYKLNSRYPITLD